MTTPHSEFFKGVKGILPILLGVFPFGLIYGVSARGAGLSASITQVMSSIVFAGSAQFVMVQLISAGIPAGIILLTTGIINLRHTLYSASVASYLKHLRTGWKLLLAYLLTDEAYAVVITHYQQPDESAYKHWYFLGAGLGLWTTWQASTATGVLLGAQIPASWSLDFALPLTFIAVVVPVLKHRVDGIVAMVAGSCAVVAVHLPLNSGLLIATFIGIGVGMLLPTKNRKTFSDEVENGSRRSEGVRSGEGERKQ